ncbi:DASH family cryptochrome [Saprospira sp. CCB-QB6]|uniref:DASH family cryptochrome n=1 Tax=Saprospira sp. CCB-QB6 TaxID=3023936 RepID=UPI002349DC71|nr:DASH family cryptochrome [Saprospira sp. CCB-QB6]WCL82342.1 DASH family cryptochrome [Saprospira sp. CCB-QB6]
MSAPPKKAKRVIAWFRLDLRLHDNEMLTEALKAGEEVYPVYVFDERTFKGKTEAGFAKTGPRRCQFIIEAVADLRQQLQALGIDLIIRTGKAEEEIFQLAQELKTGWVFCNREKTYEEEVQQNRLEEKLWTIGQEIRFFRGKMLYYTQDLPFPIAHTPDVFTQFRKEVEKLTPVREPLPKPQSFVAWSHRLALGELPQLSDFGWETPPKDERSVLHFKGGETQGLKRLHYYLWESDAIAKYKETRNGLLGPDYSSKFSPWLAQGCLSPKQIYAELKRYENERKKNKSTYWLYFELLWRDFFRLMGKKYGHQIFLYTGLRGKKKKSLSNNMQAFENWMLGQTGQPFIDANMRELAKTGFMSNRGRQNVASYLINDLKVNWQLGAEYFESTLIDYDVTSNWVNWLYIAGVGNDPREDRYFNPISQSKRYDPEGEYIKYWLPELQEVDSRDIHELDSRQFITKEPKQ